MNQLSLVSVNVGRPRPLQVGAKRSNSAIFKEPVEGRVAVRGVNVDGDDQANRTVHGGPDKAVYAYSHEDYLWWSERLGRDIGPGTFGDNLTVSGLDVSGALVGERWRIGTVTLEVAQPRIPCWKLGGRMGDPVFPRKFSQANRPGTYLRIVAEGELGAGDRIEVLERPDHEVSVGLVALVYYAAPERAAEILEAPSLPESWREWALKAAATRSVEAEARPAGPRGELPTIPPTDR